MNVPYLSKQSCVSCRSYIDDGNRTASGTHIMLRPELFCVCEVTSSFSLVTIMRHTCVNQSTALATIYGFVQLMSFQRLIVFLRIFLRKACRDGEEIGMDVTNAL